MTILSFTLNEEGVAVFHDALSCLAKFNEDVCLEALKDKLTLSTINPSKSAYVCFGFVSNRCFSRYKFEGRPQYRDKFFCQVFIRALMSIFKPRQVGDASRDREASIERCDVAVDDGPGQRSRLVATITYKNGCTSSHKLPFEIVTPIRAKFNEDEAAHWWSISSRTLRQLMDHFSPGIELLDINTDEDAGLVNFTCYTEKVSRRTAQNTEAVLKKPLHTNIAVEMGEFDDIRIEDKLHIVISVKDFRSILQHAQITSGKLSAHYARPGRPMKLFYAGDGILCEFVLMTVGENDTGGQRGRGNARAAASAAVAPVASASAQNTRPTTQAARLSDSTMNDGFNTASTASNNNNNNNNNNTNNQTQRQDGARVPLHMRSPVRPRHSQFTMRPSPVQRPPVRPPASVQDDSDSLFVSQGDGGQQGDEDQQWEPVNPDEEEEEGGNDRLEWNMSNQPNPSTLRMSHLTSQAQQQNQASGRNQAPNRLPAGLEPTQRLSEVRRFGLFPD